MPDLPPFDETRFNVQRLPFYPHNNTFDTDSLISAFDYTRHLDRLADRLAGS